MNGTEESTANAASGAGAPGTHSPVRTLADLSQTAVERFVDLEKAVLALVTKQNAAVLDMTGAMITGPAAAPLNAALDVCRVGIGVMADAERGILDVAARQSATWINAVAGYADEAGKSYRSLAGDAIDDAPDRIVAVQRLALDFATKETELAADVLKPAAESAKDRNLGEAAADSVRKNIDLLVSTQRQFVEVASKPPKARGAKA